MVTKVQKDIESVIDALEEAHEGLQDAIGFFDPDCEWSDGGRCGDGWESEFIRTSPDYKERYEDIVRDMRDMIIDLYEELLTDIAKEQGVNKAATKVIERIRGNGSGN